MQAKYAVLIILVVISALYLIGGFVGDQCTAIGNCKACWKTVPVTANSSLCPTSAPCTQEPYKQQRNAIVDMYSCACSSANANPEINKKIEESFSSHMGFSLSAEQICDPYSPYLTKLSYG